MTTEVQLLIYDLSHGLARSLSAQFLGPAHTLSIIPHTAILAFGREYYFGGGIQCTSHGDFTSYSGLSPIETQSLGRTSVTQSEFEAWCASVGRNEFAPESYDLLRKNCNNFSHEAALRGLHLSRGVPQWILDVPSRFLASPLGQIATPIIEQMQLRGPGAVGGATSSFASSTNTAAAATPQPPMQNENPWANIPAAAEKLLVETPIIDVHDKPLLSSDTKTVKICLSKLVTKDDAAETQKALAELAILLSETQTLLHHECLEKTVPYLLSKLDGEKTLSAVYSLMLLRLVVLHRPADDGARIVFSEVMGIVGGKLIGRTAGENNSIKDPLFENHAVRSMAWCTVSNAAGTQCGTGFLRSDPALFSALVDAALLDTSQESSPRVEIRQSALAFLFNVALDRSKYNTTSDDKGDLSDIEVSLLCGMFEGLDEETNSTAALRRLLVVAKVLKPSQIRDAAKSLVKDLGFVDTIASHRDNNTLSDGGAEADTSRDLAGELCLLLS